MTKQSKQAKAHVARAEEQERMLLQAQHDTLVSAIRAMVTDRFEGDYQSGVEFLAAVLIEHADGSRAHAIDAIGSVGVIDDDATATIESLASLLVGAAGSPKRARDAIRKEEAQP
jgi:hypothetical protein